MIVEAGGRRAAISADEPTAVYAIGSHLHGERPAAAGFARFGPVRVTVEIQRRNGGMTARALLGAYFAPATEGSTVVVVAVAADPLGFGRPATCAAALGAPLVPGLPSEFATAVLGVLTAPGGLLLPAGTLTVDRAGHDEVGSSPAAFAVASRVLVAALAATLAGWDQGEAARAELARD